MMIKESLYAILILSLLLPCIILVIYGLKRMLVQPLGKTVNQSIQMTHQLAIGSKERLVCVEVNGTRLLLGVTPHTISTLHVFSNTTEDPA